MSNQKDILVIGDQFAVRLWTTDKATLKMEHIIQVTQGDASINIFARDEEHANKLAAKIAHAVMEHGDFSV